MRNRYMPLGKVTAQIRYEKWWLNKRCRLIHSTGPFKLVIGVELTGPPSFVYGGVTLHYEDGTADTVHDFGAFKPRKKDVEMENQP